MKQILLALAFVGSSFVLKAQSSMYTIIQGGANLGFANEGYKGAFNGYSAHFIFGKNYNDRAYLGLGIGNERLKGKYKTNDPHQENQDQYTYDQNLFPIFVDGRLPFGEFNEQSKIGMMENARYATEMSEEEDKGLLIKAEFLYPHETLGKTNWTVSADYG